MNKALKDLRIGLVLAGGGAILGGAAGWGAWVGYNESKRQ